MARRSSDTNRPSTSKPTGSKEAAKRLPYGSYAPLSGQTDDATTEEEPAVKPREDEDDDTLSSGRDKLHE